MHTTEAIPRTRLAGQPGLAPGQAQVEIVIPVRDEERDLGPSIRRLCSYLTDHFPFDAMVTMRTMEAPTAPGPGPWTWRTSSRRCGPSASSGPGGALRSIWSHSEADVYAYMDVDLSTDLNALLPLVAPLLSGHSDVAIGTQLVRGARVIRGPRRETISRCYNRAGPGHDRRPGAAQRAAAPARG